MRHLTLLFVLLLSKTALSCQNLPYEEQIELNHEIFKLTSEFVEKVSKEADLSFIASVKDELLREPEQNEADNFYDVDVRNVNVIKGDYYDQLFWIDEYDNVTNTIRLSCNWPKVDNSIRLAKTYPFLFYVKQGLILRARVLTEKMPYFTEKDELKMFIEDVGEKENK